MKPAPPVTSTRCTIDSLTFLNVNFHHVTIMRPVAQVRRQHENEVKDRRVTEEPFFEHSARSRKMVPKVLKAAEELRRARCQRTRRTFKPHCSHNLVILPGLKVKQCRGASYPGQKLPNRRRARLR